MQEVIRGPETNAALVVPRSRTGERLSKASGCLVRWRNRLLLLTNWHVVTGKRWASMAERAADPDTQSRWMSEAHAYSPDFLEVSVWLKYGRRHLRTLALRTDPPPDDDYDLPRLAWEAEDSLLRGWEDMPTWDMVCLELARDLDEQEARLEQHYGQPVRLGYDVGEAGRAFGLAAGHPVFVVGYPSSIGNAESDPPVWTSGSIASDPMADWQGPRFLIDSRTRQGQSGSAVIAFEPAGRGLPARHQLIGVYSGRIEEQADIGSVWPVEQLLNNLSERSPVLPRIELPPSVGEPPLLL